MNTTSMMIYVLLVTILLGCQGQKDSTHTNISNQIIQEDTIMINKDSVKIEYYDFQTSQNGTRTVAYERGDGWLVELWAMKNMSNGECILYAPAADFYEIYKEFYLNGIIKERVKFMSGVAFGKREYFDEKGNCIKIVDEEKKFGKIRKEDILNLLEEEGWFNRRTGENIITEKPTLPTDYTLYREMMRYMEITFKRAVTDNNGNEIEPPKWFIRIDPRGEMYITRYIVDGNTGKFEKTVTFEPLII